MASLFVTVSDGNTDTFTSPPYIERGHISVLVGEAPVDATAYEWLNPGEIRMILLPPAGVPVTVMRTTPLTPYVDFEPGPLDSEDLDLMFRQCLYIAEEAYDQSRLNTGELSGLLHYLELLLGFDVAVSVPYPPGTGERCGEWRLPMPAILTTTDYTKARGELWGPVAAPISVELINRDPTTQTEVSLGEFVAEPGVTDMEFIPSSPDFAQPVNAGNSLMLRMGLTSSTLQGFSISLRINRRA